MLSRVVIGLITLVLGAAVLVVAWSWWPITVDRDQPDPAVLLLNNQSQSGPYYREGYFDVDDGHLHYVEAGEGKTVLFLHGFPSFWLSLSQQMEHLKSDYHVLAIDGLGVGKSSVPGSVASYKLENMVGQISLLLDEKGVEGVHIVGHDWGAAIGVGFAQRFPDRVLSLTAMSAPPQTVLLELISSGPPEADRFAYVEQFKRANPPLLVALRVPAQIYASAYAPLVEAGLMGAETGELFRQNLSKPKRLNAHLKWYRANIPSPEEITDASYWPSRDAKITAPVLFIWGEDDPVVSTKAVDLIAELSADTTLLSFPETGHRPHVEHRNDVNEAIAEFIDAIQIDDR